jgi:dTDP-4-amino-4,6-dideoxygalactose transaminase
MNDNIWKVPLSDINFGEEEQQAVLEVLQNRWLTMGSITEEFERQFADRLNVKHAVAVSNATAALHLACLVLGIGEGDQVILPSLSFVATANAPTYCGARLQFADIIGPEELTVSPEAIDAAINPRTRAMILMHYGGYPCRMAEIMDIAAKHNLAVIEDAAHAPGAALNGKFLGAWGDIGCFSFFSNKNMVTGEGGMLVTDQDDLAEKARSLRSHAMTTQTWDRHHGHAYSYDVTGLGYNYRIDEIRSALGIVQLVKLNAENAARAGITKKYRQAFENLPLKLPFENFKINSGSTSACHLFPILLPDKINRRQFMQSMRKDGIQTSIHYPPIHQFSFYTQRYPGITLPNTEYAARHEISMPLYAGMTAEQIDHVIQAVKKAV